jgi:hypothetical protein
MKMSLAAVAVVLTAGTVFATPINYGNFAGTNVNFLNVNEDNSEGPGGTTVGLFNSPTVVGNALTFSAMTFSASATGAGGVDVTDGTLRFTLQSGAGLGQFSIFENGDRTLVGAGSGSPGAAGTTANVGLALFITITEVNGVTLGAPISTNIAGVFSGGGSYNLGSGTQIASIWSGGATIDLAAILAANNISGIVTRANVILDNTLAVTSQAGTSAFIKKKELNGVTIIVPTPGAAALLGLGGLMATRRRR